MMEQLQEYLKMIDQVIENGEYKDNWESLMHHPVPKWYRNAKFGIFIHYGAYSVPEYSEWYAHAMYNKGEMRNGNDSYQHHIDTYGPHKEFGYKDIAEKLFQAEKFDAKEWLDLFEEAGAKFIMPTAEHHDGFPIYDTDLSEWCAAKKGPKRDIVGELKEEAEKRGIVLTTSSHRAEHYWFMGGGKKFESDIPQEVPYGHIYWPSITIPEGVSIYGDTESFQPSELFMQDWLARTCEIVDKYHPKIMYFDGWIEVFGMKPYLKKFAAYYYNRAKEWGEEVTINYKNDAFMYSVGVRDIERGQLSDTSPTYWQNDTTAGRNSWEYTANNTYKESVEIINDLIDVVAKNGSFLFNVGPRGDGSISEMDKKILKDMGQWLKVNGEAIYDSYNWKKYGEGPLVTEEGHMSDLIKKDYSSEDFRFTFKDGNLYVFAMKWPENGNVNIKTLGRHEGKLNARIVNVEVLGYEGEVEYQLYDNYLHVEAKDVISDKPVCMKIKLD